jgi:hypothetical protein
MNNNYEYIGKDQNISNENLGKSGKHRVIEIPVKHVSSGIEPTLKFDREKSPNLNLESHSPHRSSLFSNNSIFERCESPFGKYFLIIICMSIN